MQRLTTLLLLAGITFTAQAQTVDDYQPDSDGDGCIGMSDLLSLLSVFGSCETQAFACGDPVSYQGYDYATVLIGEQCWFAENLRSKSYQNGDSIPSGLNDNEWSSTTSGATSKYGEGSSTCFDFSPDGEACDEAWSINEFGRLYNWLAVSDARSLCPSGWHAPTEEDATELATFLSQEPFVGNQMKETFGWENDGNGNNSSGYSGLPGGSRGSDGTFYGAGIVGRWWLAAPVNAEQAKSHVLNANVSDLWLAHTSQKSGYSVRCIQDSEE